MPILYDSAITHFDDLWQVSDQPCVQIWDSLRLEHGCRNSVSATKPQYSDHSSPDTPDPYKIRSRLLSWNIRTGTLILFPASTSPFRATSTTSSLRLKITPNSSSFFPQLSSNKPKPFSVHSYDSRLPNLTSSSLQKHEEIRGPIRLSSEENGSQGTSSCSNTCNSIARGQLHQLPDPVILVGHEGQQISISPSSIPYWEKLNLQPFALWKVCIGLHEVARAGGSMISDLQLSQKPSLIELERCTICDHL